MIKLKDNKFIIQNINTARDKFFKKNIYNFLIENKSDKINYCLNYISKKYNNNKLYDLEDCKDLNNNELYFRISDNICYVYNKILDINIYKNKKGKCLFYIKTFFRRIHKNFINYASFNNFNVNDCCDLILLVNCICKILLFIIGYGILMFIFAIFICGNPNSIFCLIISSISTFVMYMFLYKICIKIKKFETTFNVIFALLLSGIYTSIIGFNGDKFNPWSLCLLPLFFFPFIICISKVSHDNFQ